MTSSPGGRAARLPWVIAVLTTAALAGLVGLLIVGQGEVPGWGPPPVGPAWKKAGPAELRSVLLQQRDRALEAGELGEAAQVHAALGHEAVLRARAVHDAWMSMRVPSTGLFPQSTQNRQWNYRNTAADFFGFMLTAALYTSAPSLPVLRETLVREQALAGAGDLCQPVDADTGQVVAADQEERLFASSEYVKDGLISVYERTGDAQIRERMLQIMDAMLGHASQDSPVGLIPSTRSETNGNLLQMCSRLALAEDRRRYADMAADIAEAQVSQVFPRNHGLPAHYFDYENDRVMEAKTQLRDHGNEMIVGLSEAFALAVTLGDDDPAWRDRADRWAEPLTRMFELILAHGVNDQGLIADILDPATLRLLDEEPSDNWGYVLCGVLLFAEKARQHGRIAPERLDALLAGVERVSAAVAATNGLAWQGRNMDGYADALEGGLYIAAHHRPSRDPLLRWVDSQVDILFQFQETDGFIGRRYLDGNFIRTALLYADQKTGGWRLDPWDADTQVGFADNDQGEAVVVVLSRDGYQGVLRPDHRRSRDFLAMPSDWPRLNSWPEWCRGEDIEQAERADADGQTLSPQAVQAGVPIRLSPNGRLELRLRLRRNATP